MKNTISDFFKKPFIRNVFILASGTAMAQAINMIFSPIITRMYGPEAYGVMGTFVAFIQILVNLATFSYPIAMVLPKYDYEAIIIGKLSLAIAVFNTIAIGTVFFIFGDLIVSVFSLEEISKFLYLIPLFILLAGILQIIHQWLIRKNMFGISAKASIIETLIVNGGKVTIGFFYPISDVLVIFSAIRQGFRALLIYLFLGVPNKKINKSFSNFNFSEIKTIAKKYKDFPLYRTPELIMSSLSTNIPILLLTTFFGAAAAGFYSISKTVLGVPSNLIAKSVGDVFYPRIANAAQNKEKISPLILRATMYLALIGIIPYGVIILFGPFLFELVFGSEWAIAGEYARWVSLWAFAMFINKPSIQALPVISAQRFQLIFTFCKLIITSIALFIGFYYFNSDIIAIAFFGISGGLSYIVLILVAYLKSRQFDDINI